MVSRSPEERALIARIAAHARWSKTPDRIAATAAARSAAADRFERQVDPDGTMDPAQRARLADNARKAHALRMSLASAKARRLRKQADDLERQAQDGGQ